MSERDDILEQLSAWLDGELPAEQARRIEQAVRTDPDLAAEADSLRQLRRLLRTVPARKAPDGFAARVMARAERAHLLGQPHASTSRSFRGISLAAAAVVLLAAGAAMIIIFYSAKPLPPGPLVMENKSNQPVPAVGRGPADKTDKNVAVNGPQSKGKVDPAPARIAKTGKESDTIPRVAKTAGTEGVAAKPKPEGPMGTEPKPVDPAMKTGADDVPPIASKSGPGQFSNMIATSPAGWHRVVLSCDNMDEARQAVEQVLARHGVGPAADRKDAASSAPASGYRNETRADGRLEIVAHVTPRQMIQLQSELVALQSRWPQCGPAVLERKQVLPMSAESGTAGAMPPGTPRPGGAASRSTNEIKPAKTRSPDTQPAQTTQEEARPERPILPGPSTRPAGQLAKQEDDSTKGQQQVTPTPKETLVAQAAAQGAGTTTQPAGQQTQPAAQRPITVAVQQEKSELQPLVITLNLAKRREPAAVAAEKPATQPSQARQAPTTMPAK